MRRKKIRRAPRTAYGGGPEPDWWSEPSPARPRAGFAVWFKRIFVGGVIAAVVATVAAIAFLGTVITKYRDAAEKIDLARLNEFSETTIFYDRRAQEIGRLFFEDRQVLQHHEIPDIMRWAILAAEDTSFYKHGGIDYRGILRAAIANIRKGRATQGGSTITQQLAKHAIGVFERNIDRKLTEFFLAKRIEAKFSKDEILDLYINRIYFGKGYYGLAAAATGYFHKKPHELTLGECAMLAGIVRAPNTYSPRGNIARATEKRDQVLGRMIDAGYIKHAQAAEARAEKITVHGGRNAGVHTFYMAQALKELRQILQVDPEDDVPGGLRVHTTIDLDLQTVVEQSLAAKLGAVEASLKTPGAAPAAGTDPLAELDTTPAEAPGAQAPPETTANGPEGPLETAFLCVESESGATRVLVGGRDFKQSQFNRATMARRGNSSLLQPFVYSLAMQHLALHPASMIDATYIDDALASKGQDTGLGDPLKDISKRFLTIQQALSLANGSCALRVAIQLGLPRIAQWLSDAGIKLETQPKSLDDIPSLTLEQIASLYQALARGGVHRRPYLIEKITNAYNEVMYQSQVEAGTRIVDPLVAQHMTLTLQSATRDGIGRSLAIEHGFTQPIASMTGRSPKNRDAWFVGYTPELVGALWVGYDQPRPITDGPVIRSAAIPLWATAMGEVMRRLPAGTSFPVPEQLAKVEVDQRTGVIQGLGFLTPAPGNIFVYLRRDQIDQAQKTSREIASRVQQPPDWSNWLATLLNEGDEASQAPSLNLPGTKEIPQVARCRLPALRGDILTRDGQPLATMVQSQSLVLKWPAGNEFRTEDDYLRWVKERLVDASEWLAEPILLPEEELQVQFRFHRFRPLTVAENLSPDRVTEFPKSPLVRQGFALQGVPRRLYPNGAFFSHSLGHVKRTTTVNNRAYYPAEPVYDDYEGASGLEKLFDKDLRGKDGQMTVVTTPDGFPRKAWLDWQATAGNNVRTTIDRGLQEAAEAAIATIRAGAIVVLDINNGDVLAMASQPQYDPNDFIPFLPEERWQELVSSEKNPLLNRAYRQHHPPGSTFKLITSLAASRAGVLDPDRKFTANGFFEVAGLRYELPKEKDTVSYQAALARSFNSYFMDLGLRAGREALIDTALQFGIGRVTGFILPGEVPGLMPDSTFTMKRHQRIFGPGDITNTSIGQGDVLVTPLQMANLAATIANGGTLYRPRLVRQIESRGGKTANRFDPAEVRHIEINPTDLNIIREAMVATTEWGTGAPAKVPDVPLATKTGTAQIGSKLAPRQVAWMVGYLPADLPRYAFAVMVEGDYDQDLHGGSDAGSLAGQIFKSEPVRPLLTAAPPKAQLVSPTENP